MLLIEHSRGSISTQKCVKEKKHMKNLLLIFLSIFSLHLHAQIVWEQNYGGSSIDELVQIKGGLNSEILLIGSTLSNDQDIETVFGQKDAILINTDIDGSINWVLSAGGSANDEFRSAIQLETGDWFVIGKSSSIDFDITDGNESEQGLLCKVSPSGELIWCKTYGEDEDDEFFSISQTSSGNLLLSGAVDNENLFPEDVLRHSNQDFWLLELSPEGNVIWEKKYGGTDGEQAFDHIQDESGNIYMTGYAISDDMDLDINYGLKDIWVVKTDSAGNIIWKESYGGSSFDEGKKLLLANNTLFVVGSTFSNDQTFQDQLIGQEDGFILALDPETGQLKDQINTGGTLSDRINDLIISNDQIITVGFTRSLLNGIAGNGGADYWLRAFDFDLQTKWTRRFGGTNEEVAQSIILQNGSMFIAGSSYSTDIDVSDNYGLADIWLLNHDWVNSTIKPTSPEVFFESNASQLTVKGLPNGAYHYFVNDLLGRQIQTGQFTINDSDIEIERPQSPHFFLNIVNIKDQSINYLLKGITIR